MSRASAAVAYDSALADARYALRVFRRSPMFGFGVVLVAGLGIAINSAVFAALNALFLRPLPVPQPREIVRVYTSEAGNGGRYGGNSYPDYVDLMQVPTLTGLAASVPLSTNIRVDDALVRAEGRLVSENFFDVLGVRATVGDLFSARRAPAADRVVVVLSQGFWRRHFEGDANVVGRQIEVNAARATIVGVLPRTFAIEPSAVDVYMPAGAHREVAPGFEFVDTRGARLVRLIGRLAPGATEARAANDLNIVMSNLATPYGDTNRNRLVSVTPASALVDRVASPIRLAPVVPLLFSVSGILLLIATVNVAGLLLARTVTRRNELAVRASLGASRVRILRQLVTESLLLGVVSEVVALSVLAGLPAIARALEIPEAVQFGLDVRVFAFASAVTLVTAVGFSIGPALRASAERPFDALRASLVTMPLSRARGQRVMVVAQVALAITLVSAATLLAQSIRRQYSVNPGFVTRNVVSVEFEWAPGVPTPDVDRAFAPIALEHARRIPGVVSATVTPSAPLTSEGARMTITIPDFRSDGYLEVPFSNVGTDYCATLGVRLIEGEELHARNGAAEPRRAILVNESMAKRYWPGRSPVGLTVRLGGGTVLHVIGVVADARMVALTQSADPHFYVQSDAGVGSTLLIRTRTEAGGMKPMLQRTFSGGIDGYILRRVRSMEDVISESLAEAKAFAGLTSAISVLALVLAVSALYALLSYLSVQRRREFGIRLALGATTRDVMALVLSLGLRLTALGVGLGLLSTVATLQALQAVVFAPSAVDIVIVLAVASVAGVIAVCACAIPALRAAAALPSTTLRVE